MGCIRRVVGCLTTLVLLAAVIAFGAYLLLLNLMQNDLADAVRRKFMLPPSSTVTITPGSYVESLSGKVKAFHIESAEASISNTRIASLKLDAENLSFNVVNLALGRDPILREVEHAKVSFAIAPEALADAWLARVKRVGVKKLTMKLEEGTGDQLPYADVEAVANVLGKEIDLSVKGFFKLAGKREIAFEALEFKLEDLKLGGQLIESVFIQMAPKIRIGDFQGDLTIDKFYVLGGKLQVFAQTTGVTLLEGGSEDAQAKEVKQ